MEVSYESIASLLELKLRRVDAFRGEVRVPGSKSMANRALLLSALAEGRTRISNLPSSDDVQLLVQTLPRLGIITEEIEEPGDSKPSVGDAVSDLIVEGCGGALPIKEAEINLENAGTAMRPLTALLSAGEGKFTLDGNESMRRRPIVDLVRALQGLGVEIECSEKGTPPIQIKATGLSGGIVRLSGKVSSQFITGMLLVGPLARERDLIIELPEEPVSKPYIDLTLSMMKDFGVEVQHEGYRRFQIPRSVYRSPGEFRIEGDASAATYFLAAGSIPALGPVRVRGISRNSRQGDARFARVLEEMGARIEYGEDWIEVIGAQKLKGIDIDMNDMPDAAMTLAVLALFAEGPTHIRNIANLRVKESERIHGLRTELEKLGAEVKEEHDSLLINPPARLKQCTIKTYGDHRMAMAFSLASLGTGIVIENPACVSKTYPEYFQDFYHLVHGSSR